MLNTLIIVSAILWIGGFFINGFTVYQILLIIPTIMFAMRKFGIHIKLANILLVEFFFLFASTVWRLIFHKAILWRWLVSLLIRIIFFCIIIYDDTVYVYVTEEKKKDG